MGQAMSAKRRELQDMARSSGGDTFQKVSPVIEQLDFLQRMADSKLDIMEANLLATFRDPGYQNKVQIIGDRAMRTERRFNVNATSDAEQVRSSPLGDSAVSQPMLPQIRFSLAVRNSK
jgi:hypothetical protein